MKEKKHKKNKSHSSKHHKTNKKSSKHTKYESSSSDSDTSGSSEWVEKKTHEDNLSDKREQWMGMTGMLKTYSKNDIKIKREEKKNDHIDSYNPGSSSRELNPYWRDGGTGLPQPAESFRKSRQFMKPSEEDDDYYTTKNYSKVKSPSEQKHSSGYRETKDYYGDSSRNQRSYKWKKNENEDTKSCKVEELVTSNTEPSTSGTEMTKLSKKEDKYLSDDKMNKLAAKIVKAEIMGNTKLAEELKEKLEAAREFRKQNPDAGKAVEEDGVMLITTNKMGNTMPLEKTEMSKHKSNKRKVQTHISGERAKYFGNDDKYNLAQMFQQEKYGSNHHDEAEFSKIVSKHKNPNDDLEDIFMDEISKNRNEAKDNEIERNRSINQHRTIEKSLDGCEHCIDSKNMVKHLIVSCGNKVYLALPARKSLVKDHCIISTTQHAICVTGVDEDVWEEIMNYRKALTRLFHSQNMDVVFFETATKLHRHPHLVIHCVPLPRDVGDTAAIYFKKALLECETEWSMNKKVVDLKGKNIRKGIPKGLPYFWIDFGMDPGFAHIIEDQQLFPKTFAEEIIGGMLDLDHSLWKNPKKDYGDAQRKKVLDFIRNWKEFDPVSNKIS